MRFLVLVSGFFSSSNFSSSNFSLSSFVGGEMVSASSSNFRSLNYGNRASSCYWDVGSSDSEPVDIVSSVVDGLDDIVGVNVLITSSGHTESVLGFRPGGVDVLVAEAELSQLVLRNILFKMRRKD